MCQNNVNQQEQLSQLAQRAIHVFLQGFQSRDLILELATLIERDSEFLEALESLDNGKPLGREGQYGTSADVSLTIKCFRYYAGWADKLQGKTIPVEGSFLCYTQKACTVPSSS